MANTVKCALCGEQVPNDCKVRVDNKNFHLQCAQDYGEKKELCTYICRIFNLKKPGPINYRLMKQYKEKGYTYAGMRQALQYFYEVKGGDSDKAEERIGIIPYVYEEAKEYYNLVNEKKEELTNIIANQEEKGVIEVTLKVPERKRRKTYNLTEF